MIPKTKNTFKTVLIDDEYPVRNNLKTLLEMDFPELEIIGEADSVETGVKLLNEVSPDVVFLDVNLSDGSGFNLLEQLNETRFQVIFVTAYDNFAISAFKVNALDYLLKPVGLIDLKNAVDRLKNTTRFLGASDLEIIKNNWSGISKQTGKLAIREHGGIRYLNIREIMRCQSHNNYTEIHLRCGEHIMTSRTLKEYSGILEQYGFFRIYQSHLINLHFVKKILHKDGLYVEMDDGKILELSRDKKVRLMERMKLLQIA